MSTEPKYRTITLTGRRPVRIREDHWPIVADGTWADHDGQVEAKANRRWRLNIRVRQHEDGRAIVYGVYDYDTHHQGTAGFMCRAGALMAPGDDLPMAIAEVGEVIRRRICNDAPVDHAQSGSAHVSAVVAECIGELEPETL